LKVAFVRAGSEQRLDLRPYIRAQSDSLEQIGVGITNFYVEGGNALRYLGAVAPLRRFVRKHRFDLIHAHYGYCGLVSLFARTEEPLIVSFMGTDLYGGLNAKGKISLQGRLNVRMAKFLAERSAGLIVKSERMVPFVPAMCRDKTVVIPNGVNLKIVGPQEQAEAREALSLIENEPMVLFLGDQEDPRKNYRLFLEACRLLRHKDVHVAAPYPVTHEEVVLYLNAADVMVVTSTHEGSPNIVKEAMACNLPVVSVDVGDVAERLRNVRPSRVCAYDAAQLAGAVDDVLAGRERSNGRQVLLDEGLDTESIAQKIREFYERILDGRNVGLAVRA
jgi:teichuronic acid biosynthesis glycosyltransferase TuaC